MASFGRFTPSSGGVVETLSYTSPTLSLTQSAGTSPLTATIAGGGVDGSGTINILSKWIDENTLGDSFYYSGGDDIAKTIYEGNNFGLYIDFASNNSRLYNNNGLGFAVLSNNDVYIGDPDGFGNNIILLIDNTNQIINTGNSGLYLDFPNSVYTLGQQGDNNTLKLNCGNNIFQLGNTDNRGLYIDLSNSIYKLGDFGYSISGTNFIVDDSNQNIKTEYQGNELGFKLNYANDLYWFGSDQRGLYLDFTNDQYTFGDYGNYSNATKLFIDDSNRYIATKSNATNLGLYVNFNSSIYALGITETGDFDTELVAGFKANLDTGIYTIGDAGALITGSDLTLDAVNERFNINTSRTHLSNLDTSTINALPAPLEGDIVYNNTLHAPCFYDGAGWFRLVHLPM